MKFTIKEPVFETGLTIYWGDDKFFGDVGHNKEEHSESLGLFATNGLNYPKIWIRDVKDKVKVLGTLSHELIHFLSYLDDTVGITFSKDSEEFFAYMHSYYLEKAIKKMGLLK